MIELNTSEASPTEVSKFKMRLQEELKKIWERTGYRCNCCGVEKKMGQKIVHDKECHYHD